MKEKENLEEKQEEVEKEKEEEYLRILNANYLQKFSKNYLSKLQIYLDDQVYLKKTEDLPQLKSITILKFEKMIKKENMIKKKKKLKDLRRFTMDGNDKSLKSKLGQGDLNQISKINQTGQIGKTNSKIKNEKNLYTKIRYIILDAGNKLIDIHNMDEDFTKSDMNDPYKTYLQEENEKLRRQALDKIVSNAMNSTNSIKASSLNKRLKYESVKSTDSNSPIKSDYNTISNQSNILNNKFSRDKEAIDMHSIHFSKKRGSYTNSSDWNSAREADQYEKENFENFLKFFKEACEMNNFVTIDQKIDYFTHLRNNIYLNKSKSDRRNVIRVKTTHRRKGQLGDTGELVSGLQDTQPANKDINYNSMSSLPQIQTFYENHKENNRDSLANSNSHISIRKMNTHKPTISFNIQHKYILDLKNKFKTLDEISYKMQVDLENFYTDFLSRVKSLQGMNDQGNYQENLSLASTNSFERIKSQINTKELSNEKIILRECEINIERFVYMIGKRVFDFKFLRHVNLSRNLLGDTGASYLLYLIKLYSNSLEYLDISYNKIGKHSCDLINEILVEDKIELIYLNISGNKIGDKNFSEICVGISKNSSLEKLSTSANDLGKISSIILGTILRYDKKLKFLDVSKNFLHDEIIKNLLRGLISNCTLETLILNENNLTNSSLKHFETCLSVNDTIKEIFLERNLFSENSSLKFLSILFKNCSIEYVSLIGNKLNTKFAEDLIDNEKKMPIRVVNKSDYLQMRMKADDKINFHEIF